MYNVFHNPLCYEDRLQKYMESVIKTNKEIHCKKVCTSTSYGQNLWYILMTYSIYF